MTEQCNEKDKELKKVMKKLKEKDEKLEKAVDEKLIKEDADILRRQKKWLNDKDFTIDRLHFELERMKWNNESERNKKRQREEEEVRMRKKVRLELEDEERQRRASRYHRM